MNNPLQPIVQIVEQFKQLFQGNKVATIIIALSVFVVSLAFCMRIVPPCFLAPLGHIEVKKGAAQHARSHGGQTSTIDSACQPLEKGTETNY